MRYHPSFPFREVARKKERKKERKKFYITKTSKGLKRELEREVLDIGAWYSSAIDSFNNYYNCKDVESVRDRARY
jgi:hypothetical protein